MTYGYASHFVKSDFRGNAILPKMNFLIISFVKFKLSISLKTILILGTETIQNGHLNSAQVFTESLTIILLYL